MTGELIYDTEFNLKNKFYTLKKQPNNFQNNFWSLFQHFYKFTKMKSEIDNFSQKTSNNKKKEKEV